METTTTPRIPIPSLEEATLLTSLKFIIYFIFMYGQMQPETNVRKKIIEYHFITIFLAKIDKSAFKQAQTMFFLLSVCYQTSL